MGDIGEYWRDHKEYVERRKRGMSQKQWDKFNAEIAAENKAAREARKIFQCECGKGLVDLNAHKCHKQRFGKKGHRLLNPDAQPPASDTDFDIAF